MTRPLARRLARMPLRACALPAVLLLAACGSGGEQADLCERVTERLYGGAGAVTIVKTERFEEERPRVAVDFRSAADTQSPVMTVTCTFAGKDGDASLDLVGVRRADNRPLHLVSVIFLKRQLSGDSTH